MNHYLIIKGDQGRPYARIFSLFQLSAFHILSILLIPVRLRQAV